MLDLADQPTQSGVFGTYRMVWQRFDSSATVHRVLDGMGSIEELRKADRTYMGFGDRVTMSP